MFEIIATIIAVVLFVNIIKVFFKLTWGVAKIIATVLLVLALPAFAVCMIFFGGLFLLIPLVLLAAVFVIVKVVK